MKTHRDIIGAWKNAATFAADVGIKPESARQMRFRNSIPSKYWPAVVAASNRRRKGITFELLALTQVNGK